MSQRLRVTCTLKDCAWWHAVAERPASRDACDCSHPEKETYRHSMPCPLYKKDWRDEVDTAKQLAERFARRGSRGGR